MTDLIRRLETDQPSDELLADALVALGWRRNVEYEPDCFKWATPSGDTYFDHEVPDLLRSLDAVLAQMPEGWEWSRHLGANGRMTMQVDVPERPFGVFHGQGATPAMALLAAQMKAKET